MAKFVKSTCKICKFPSMIFYLCPQCEQWLNARYGVRHVTEIWACFLSLVRSNLRLCYWSNLSCDWVRIAWAYSKQDTENGHCAATTAFVIMNFHVQDRSVLLTQHNQNLTANCVFLPSSTLHIDLNWMHYICVFNSLFGLTKYQSSCEFPTQRASNMRSVSRVTSHPVATAAVWKHACIFSRRTVISPFVVVITVYLMLACSGVVFGDVPPSVITPADVHAMYDKPRRWRDIYLFIRCHTQLGAVSSSIITPREVQVIYD